MALAGNAVRRMRNIVAAAGTVAVIVGLVVTLLGGGSGLTPAAAASEALASLDILADRVDWQASATADYQPAEQDQALQAGNGLRTDSTGLGQVDYADGSLSRLDADTTFRVLEVSGEVLAPTVRVELDLGRVYSRVQHVTGQVGSFEVETAVGTAAVRGTAFSIACDATGTCTIEVVDGVVVITTPDGQQIRVEAGDTVVLGPPGDDGAVGGDGGGDGGPDGGDATGGDGTPPTVVELDRTTVDPAAMGAASPWLTDNLARDEATGRFGPEAENCSATLAGRNARLARTPQTAIEVPFDAVPPALGVSAEAIDGYEFRLRIAGLEFPAADGGVRRPREVFAGDVRVADYAWVGVGIYEVAAVTTGTVCRATGYVEVVGRSPLTTVAGAIAALLGVGGLALAFGALTRDPTKGVWRRRMTGLVGGALGGAGIAVLVQQYGALPLTPTTLAGFALVLGGLVAALTRPAAPGAPPPQPGQPPQPAQPPGPEDQA